MDRREAEEITEAMEKKHPEFKNGGNTLLIPILDVREYCIAKYFIEGSDYERKRAEKMAKEVENLIGWQEKWKSPIESGLAVRFFNLKKALSEYRKGES